MNDCHSVLMVSSFLLLDVVSTPYDEVNKTSSTSSPDVTHSQGSKIVHFVDQLKKKTTEGIFFIRLDAHERSQKIYVHLTLLC